MLNRNYMLKRHNINSVKLKVELDLSNYETKTDLKNTTGIDKSSFAKKIQLV